MNQYVDQLERRLHEAITAEQQRTSRVRSIRPHQQRRAIAVIGSLAVAVIAVLVALSAGPSADTARAYSLPAMKANPTDARAIRDGLPARERRTLDFTQGRAFSAANGTGYVLPSTDGRGLCITLPDTVKDAAGITCAPTAQAEANGLVLTRVVAEGMAGQSEVAAAIPAGATDLQIAYRSGEHRPLQARNGIAVLTVTRDLTISWTTVSGNVIKTPVEAVARDTASFGDCGGDIGIVEIPRGESFDRDRYCKR